MSKRGRTHTDSKSPNGYSLFLRTLRTVLEKYFEGTEYRLATAANVDPALVKRVRSGERAPTPLFVGKIAKAIGEEEGNTLIGAYLKDVEQQVRHMRPSRRD